MILVHPYQLTDVAPFTGTLESGFIAHLSRDGRVVARVIDEGDRGPILWQWRRLGRAGQEDEAALDAYLDALPPLVTKRISIPEWCPDAFIYQLRREARAVAWMLPYCEHHTVLLVMGIDGWGRWRLVDELFAPRRARKLAAAHDALMILNEHPGAAAWNPAPHEAALTVGRESGAPRQRERGQAWRVDLDRFPRQGRLGDAYRFVDSLPMMHAKDGIVGGASAAV